MLKIIYVKGEPLTDDDVETLLKECCDSEDEDGCIPYESSIFAYFKNTFRLTVRK